MSELDIKKRLYDYILTCFYYKIIIKNNVEHIQDHVDFLNESKREILQHVLLL